MYTLELTKAERDAIDWVGGRYSHGEDLRKLLENETVTKVCPYPECEDVEWEDAVPIEFSIPEHVAWTILEIRDQDPMWCCFHQDFARKLNAFCDRIV